MHVLLKSGQSASREEAIEEMKERRSTVLKMEDMNFGRKSIDAQTTTSSDTKFDRHSATNIDRRHPAGSR
ncbi:hypothetical protein F2Q68_00010584 [Brassica cretica]|uniref:Uncharacterized protein n=1 Tax=Brassica cretica TaxID=69181 RepID=A0A8S9L1Y9_BRACR|nr:hypothetical protein F2Q68_00010584 [Brassica cretica]